jgi:hypothetical protein
LASNSSHPVTTAFSDASCCVYRTAGAGRSGVDKEGGRLRLQWSERARARLNKHGKAPLGSGTAGVAWIFFP